MRWLILILILSSLFISGCFYRESFEKEPVLEQYILLRAGTAEINSSMEKNQENPSINTTPH